MAKNVVYYRSSEKIIETGSTEKKMYIILEGEVHITLGSGANTFKVAELKKGDFFGEISLFADTPRSANVIAAGDVKVVFIDSPEDLKAFLLRNPPFAAKMVQSLAKRIAKTDEILIGKVSELNRMRLTREI